MNPTIEEIREACRKDFILFGQTIRPRMAKVKPAKFHRTIGKYWKERREKVVIQAPRG